MPTNSAGSALPRGERRIRGVLRGCLYGGMAFIVVMMFLTVAHGVGRYAFNQPIPGMIELSSYFLITSVFLVGAYVMLEKAHVRIGVIVDRFSERTQAIINSITYILCLAVAMIALRFTITRAILWLQEGQASAVLDIPNFPFISIVAVGWGIFGLALVMHLVHLLPRAVKK